MSAIIDCSNGGNEKADSDENSKCLFQNSNQINFMRFLRQECATRHHIFVLFLKDKGFIAYPREINAGAYPSETMTPHTTCKRNKEKVKLSKPWR